MDLPEVVPAAHSSQTICIIGGGPSGLAALKLIKETQQYRGGLWKPFLYEERDRPGGIRTPAPPTDNPPLSPLYESLTTNLPHICMSYTDFPFPPSTPIFPKAHVVEDYLLAYIHHFNLASEIHLRTRVTSVVREPNFWTVTLSTGETKTFDLVLICNGHYRIPRIPDVPGLTDWINTTTAMHSVFYRRPDGFGDVVLVIGGGPSGQDISSDLRAVSKTVIHSIRGTTPSNNGNLKIRGAVTEFRPNGVVVFEDGTTESDVTFCILATGYEMSFPFLSPSILVPSYPPPIPPLPAKAFNTTHSVFPLARHVIPVQQNFPPHTLAFIGLLFRVSPLPLVEAQVKAALRVFHNPSSFNYTEEAVDIMTRYSTLSSKLQTDNVELIMKDWHKFVDSEAFDYRDTLCRFAEIEMSFTKTRVPEWEPEFFFQKDLLRRMWVKLEKEGKAEDFVRGVGMGGPQEWVEALRKLAKMAQEDVEVRDAQVAKRIPRL